MHSINRNIFSGIRHILLLVTVVSKGAYCGQLCLSCSEADTTNDCLKFVRCNDDQVCFLHKYRTDLNQTKYDAGCTYPELCIKKESTGNIFGKRNSLHGHVVCQSCCNDTRICNTDLTCKEPAIARTVSCLSCSGVDDPESCSRETICNRDEVCYLHKYKTESQRDLFDLGCKHSMFCSQGVGNLFGKRQSEGRTMICESCCSDKNFCNGELQCMHHDQKNINANCSSANECLGNLICNSGRCQCPTEEYFWAGTECKRKKIFNAVCLSSNECQKEFQCRLGICQCMEQTNWWNGTHCLSRKSVHEKCSVSSECQETLYCIHGECKCDAGLEYWNGSSCVSKKPQYSVCSVQEECFGNLQCLSNLCVCSSDMYYWDGTQCTTKKVINSSCIHTEECSSNLQCLFNNCSCLSSNYHWDGQTCVLTTFPKECEDIAANINGVYEIYPRGPKHKILVYCIMEENKKWTVFQMRFNESVDFYRNWTEYKNGFGSPFGEYWLGNDIIHEISVNGTHELAIHLYLSNGTSAFANYTDFKIEDELHKYTIRLSGYHGNAGDEFNYPDTKYRQNGKPFTTYDQDNDSYPSNCAVQHKSGWWYAACLACDLNISHGGKLFWTNLTLMSKSIMMIRRH